ncbi:MAG TPA: flagellar biosynthesis protein FlhB [Xanthobacteraceae bacterium]|nr:flagellar biosynthesis protein FlhB [Xanthobacteraceae bacterium]
MAEAERHDAERTEEPTQKRLEEAFRRGDVAKSQEVSTWFVITGATLVLVVFSGTIAGNLSITLRGLLGNAHDIPLSANGALGLAYRLSRETLAAVMLPLLLLMLAALFGNVIQHRLVWSVEPLRPRLSKISLLGGLHRLFSKQALINLLKGLVKLVLIGAVMGALLWPQRNRLEVLVTVDLRGVLMLAKSLSFEILGAVVAVLALVAAADYLFQYRQWYERQKMSVQELREEFKQTEGDPIIKARFRQLRQTRMRKRMMAAVPRATVVITNPEHYAVALQYERGMNAPICLAKGVDIVALKIREIAEEHDVPVVENAPLARALYATVDIDEEIPPEHYKAVAEIIGYVMKLRRRATHLQ